MSALTLSCWTAQVEDVTIVVEPGVVISTSGAGHGVEGGEDPNRCGVGVSPAETGLDEVLGAVGIGR